MLTLRKQLANLVSVGEAANHWQDNDKLANLDVSVYGSPSDAHEAMAPFNTFSRAWGRRTGRVIKNEDVQSLGDEAWRLFVRGPTGSQATYHWRRDNLVLEAHIHCFGSCPGDIAAATRTWVDAIAAEAR